MAMAYDQPMFGRRLRREGGHRLPVVIVTGFLGAGKTTLVKCLLDNPDVSRTAVIVNEFGEVGLDDRLLRTSTETTVLLDRGCLCCTVRSDLQQTLRDLLHDRAGRQLPSFDRILIETSGLADPGPILQTFLGDQGLAKELYLLAVVCVVDAAVLTVKPLSSAPEGAKQLALADRIVISKRDLISNADFESVLDRVKAVNPSAPIAIANNGTVDPQFLLDDSGQQLVRTTFFAEPVEHLPDIETFSITFEEPLIWTSFAWAMDALRAHRGADILRVKGLLDIEGCEGPVLVHYVQHLAHPPMELDHWPAGSQRSHLVFITRGLKRSAVLNLLKSIQDVARSEERAPAS
jgi:G3E family GTPase